MREQRWLLNGIPVVFSRDGVLLDGMQRMLACVEARCGFETLIADGIEDDAGVLLQRHHRGAPPRPCAARGNDHVRAVDAALRTLVRCAAGTVDAQHEPAVGRAALDGALRAHPMIGRAVGVSLAMTGCPLPEAIRSPLICMGYAIDRAKTDRLLSAVSRPECFRQTEPGVVLRWWIGAMGAGLGDPSSQPSEARLLALAIRALAATLNDTPLFGSAWPVGDAAPRFPQLVGASAMTAVEPVLPAESDPSMDLARRQDGPWVGIERIGPLRAARYLAQSAGRRRISGRRVATLARDMLEGNWISSVQPICFAASGRLLDGQHRLQAIIVAGCEMEMPVLRGLREEARATYDIHARRGVVVGDAFECFGDRALAAAMANLLWRHEQRTPSTRAKKASSADVIAIIAAHPRLMLLRSFARRMTDFGRPSVIGYAAYTMERDDDALARRFLGMFETGADLTPGHPILALRNALQKHRIARITQEAELKVLLDGWEHFKTWSASPRGERRLRQRSATA
ncbi:hypothetical protein [Neoroseomonas rubea]|uniref:hypothetical protein n=1 Tax=Neoroseomonas rubea TaxID=2748666 RepID=UPI0018DFBB18|nr:hypothetical protein [Roseomonas rubea]